MGKRSTNTTKSGKFMNPTDQARKEARRRELKKNKKQRQMVRCQFYPMTYVQSRAAVMSKNLMGTNGRFNPPTFWLK